MDIFDLLEEIIYEIKKKYRIWKNGCKKCKLFDECFDYLDGKRCFVKEQNNGNKGTKD